MGRGLTFPAFWKKRKCRQYILNSELIHLIYVFLYWFKSSSYYVILNLCLEKIVLPIIWDDNAVSHCISTWELFNTKIAISRHHVSLFIGCFEILQGKRSFVEFLFDDFRKGDNVWNFLPIVVPDKAVNIAHRLFLLSLHCENLWNVCRIFLSVCVMRSFSLRLLYAVYSSSLIFLN